MINEIQSLHEHKLDLTGQTCPSNKKSSFVAAAAAGNFSAADVSSAAAGGGFGGSGGGSGGGSTTAIHTSIRSRVQTKPGCDHGPVRSLAAR